MTHLVSRAFPSDFVHSDSLTLFFWICLDFGSTYEREVQFTDDIWRSRVLQPSAKTIVATETGETGDILSSITIVRDLPVESLVQERLGFDRDDPSTKPTLHWTVNGVYTAPQARRKGVMRALISKALEFGFDVALSEGRSCLVTVLAMKDNTAAIKLYEQAGFKLVHDSKVEKDAVQLILYRPWVAV